MTGAEFAKMYETVFAQADAEAKGRPRMPQDNASQPYAAAFAMIRGRNEEVRVAAVTDTGCGDFVLLRCRNALDRNGTERLILARAADLLLRFEFVGTA